MVLLNQGGIAATGLSNGGSIQAIRMEHVWVRAYVNWAPGRGSQNASASQYVGDVIGKKIIAQTLRTLLVSRRLAASHARPDGSR